MGQALGNKPWGPWHCVLSPTQGMGLALSLGRQGMCSYNHLNTAVT